MIALENNTGRSSRIYRVQVITEDGERCTLDGFDPEEWFNRQDERIQAEKDRQLKYEQDHPRGPFVTEVDMMGVQSFSDLITRMQKAKIQDEVAYDEYEHTRTDYSDAVLAQAVMYLALSLKDPKLVEQARELIKTYRSGPVMPDLENARSKLKGFGLPLSQLKELGSLTPKG